MERCQVTIAGKAIGVNLTRSEWAVSACQAGIYSRSPGELFLTPNEYMQRTHTCTHTHTRICMSTNTQTVNACSAFRVTEYAAQLKLLVDAQRRKEQHEVALSLIHIKCLNARCYHVAFVSLNVSALRCRRYKRRLPGDLWPQQREPTAYLCFYDTVCFVRVHIKYTGNGLMPILPWSSLLFSLWWL